MSTADWQQPTGGIPPGRSGAPRRGIWVKLTIFLLILAILAWVILLAADYFKTGQPITDLGTLPKPVAQLFKEPAQYERSFLGVLRPLGVAVGADGKIYVTESEGERKIHVFDSLGQEVGAFAPPGTTVSGRTPTYIALSPKGEIYVSDRTGRAIHIFSTDGSSLGTFQPRGVPAEDWHPMGLAFDGEGNLYVTDLSEQKHRVLVFDSSGALKLEFGRQGGEPGQFWFPNGIAVDGQGRIYVADGNNGRLQVFDAEGQLLFVISRGYGPGDLSMPRGVAVDDKDHLFVADTSADVIKVYDISGDRPKYLRDIGVSGSGDGQFRFPNGVAVTGNRIYVTDKENGRVQVWSY